jgi:hypothetical protein
MNTVVCKFCRGVVVALAIVAANGASASTLSMLVKSVSSSGYYSGTYGTTLPDMVFDGSLESGWLTDTSFSSQITYYLRVDLTMGVRPVSYTISEGSSIKLARRPKSFKLYASVDGVDWVEIDSQSNIVWQDKVSENKIFNIDPANLADGVYYRAFKLELLEPSATGDSYAFFIGELDMDIGEASNPDDFSLIDIVKMSRESEVATPFNISSTGERTADGNSQQLFDGDESCNNVADSDHNGRTMFNLAEDPSVTISFDMESFGNRTVFLHGYGFRMANISSWSVLARLPRIWEVYVSDKVSPGENDWTLADCRTNAWASSSGAIYSANFQMDGFWLIRHVRFVFKEANTDATTVQLGEICLTGLIGPNQQGLRDVGLYETDPVDVHSNGTAAAAVTILQRGMELDPYDLFVAYGTDGAMETNLLVQGTRFTGKYETMIGGLRLGSNYSLQFLARPSGGGTVSGETVRFTAPHDVMVSRLPGGYVEVEYIESTDTGHQYIDCGFAPSNFILGFDLDFIGYNAFMRGAYHDTDNRETGYGVYLSSTVKGQDAWVLVSSSTGGTGNYPDGLFVYSGGAMKAKLTRGERMSVLLGNGKYTTICGTTTNEQNITRRRITGPTLSLFASENGPGNDPDQFAVMRLYSLKVYDDAVSPRELVHDFVPAKRKSDNAYGLYDLVTDNWCPNGSATPFLAGPAVGGDDLTIGSVSFAGGTLTVTLNRSGTSTAATDVYAAWGATYGGVGTAAWEHTAKCGAFAENAQTAKFTTPALARDTVYVRFYTSDGKWSETVYLPDYKKSYGFVIIVR